MSEETLIKRKTCYIMEPYNYDIRCDLCDGINITWSEYEHHIWCFDCKKDTKGTQGIFGGPISVNISNVLGINFDKVELETGKKLLFTMKEGKISWEPKNI